MLPTTVALAWEVLAENPIRRYVTRKVREWRKVQRIVWPDDRAVFEASWRIYDLGNQDLLDEPADVMAWLQEDAAKHPEADVDAEEFWIVARKRAGRIGKKRLAGILYATFYSRPSARCFVWQVGIDDTVPGAGELRLSLWQGLQESIYKSTKSRACEYFFEDVPAEGTDGEDDLLRRESYLQFLKEIGALKVDTEYVIPDRSEKHDPNEEFQGELFYLGRARADVVERDVLLDFVYGMVYFWMFVYGREEDSFEKLEGRVEYYRGLINRERVDKPDELPLVPIEVARVET